MVKYRWVAGKGKHWKSFRTKKGAVRYVKSHGLSKRHILDLNKKIRIY